MAIIKKYLASIIDIDNPIDRVYKLTIRSERKIFKYNPGQFLHLSIDNTYDGIGQWPESRCFSIQSNPNNETITITYAVKGKFTKEMASKLTIGSAIWVKLPYGDLFSQPHNKENSVFISGGTGITPFLSLFTHNSFNEYKNPKIYLGFKTKGFNIYQSDLNRISNKSYSITEYYEDENGVINIEKIYEENGTKSDYFISGPPQMIQRFKNVLMGKSVKVENIFTDDWE